MQAERHARLRELFDSAIKLDGDSRQSFIEDACGDDAELRGELESLLRSVEASADGELLSDRRIDQQRARLDGMLDAGATVTGSASPGDRPALAAPPETIGQYRIKRAIASGGMGTVYEAEQDSPRRVVALKVIRQGLATPALLRRFELESQVLGRLQHPGIAQIYQAGTAQTDQGRQPYFAMEFVRGTDLREFVRRDNLSTRQRLELLARICDAVHHAHQKGVIHRDLKPGNILVDESGQPKILDFGVARVTDSDVQVTTMRTDVGQLIGTLQYMSPEQVSADPHEIDTRSDVYSLGVIAYEILTGQAPYDLKNKMIHEAVRIIREEELTRLSTVSRTLRGDIETIVAKAMEKDKERRYTSAADLGQDIRRHLNNEPILARPPSALYQLQKFAKRNKALAGGLAIAMAALLVGMVTSSILYYRAENARELAEKTAGELQQVSDFQAGMLAQIDPTKAGQGLTEDVVAKFAEALAKANVPETERAGQVESFKSQWRRVNATDAARELIDRTILKPAIRTIDERFKDQPLVDAQLRHTLAERYYGLGLYEAAQPSQASALATRRRVLGDDHPDTLNSINNLGVMLQAQGKSDEAMPYYREALEGRRRVLGDDHPETLKSINNMGFLLEKEGKLGEAMPYSREALEGQRRVLGDDHPDTLGSITNMGALLQSQGKLDEAVPYSSEALAGYRRVLGDEHPNTLLSISNMGVLLKDQGKLDEAEPYLREALEARRRVLGDDHPNTLDSINSMGHLLLKQGKLDEAMPYHRDALERFRRVLGDEHPDTLRSINNVGVLLFKLGQYAQAEHYLRESLDAKHRVLGGDHRETIQGTNNLGAVLNLLGRHQEAADLLRFGEAAARRVYVDDNAWLMGNYLVKLGEAQTGFGEHAAAEKTLMEAHGLLVPGLGEKHAETKKAVDALIKLYDAWHTAEPDQGHDQQAAVWRELLDSQTAGSKGLQGGDE